MKTKLMMTAILASLIQACGQEAPKAPVALTTAQKTEHLEQLCLAYKEAKENWIMNENADQAKFGKTWEPFKAMIRAGAAYQVEVGETPLVAVLNGIFGYGTPMSRIMAGAIPKGERDDISIRIHQYILHGEGGLALKSPYDR